MGKKFFIYVGLMIILISSISYSQSDEDSIRKLIREWETAYNNHDIQKVLDCWDEFGVIASGYRKFALNKNQYADYLPKRFKMVPKIEVKSIENIYVKSNEAEATIQLKNYPAPSAKWTGKKEFPVTFFLIKGDEQNWRFLTWEY